MDFDFNFSLINLNKAGCVQAHRHAHACVPFVLWNNTLKIFPGEYFLPGFCGCNLEFLAWTLKGMGGKGGEWDQSVEEPSAMVEHYAGIILYKPH